MTSTRTDAGPQRLGTLALGVLALFVFTIPFEEVVTIPGVGSVTRLLGFAAIGIGLAALVRNGVASFKMPMVFYAVALAFVAWNLTSYFWSVFPAATVRQFIVYGQLFAFVWLVGEHARSPARLAVLMQAFVLGNVVSFALTTQTVLFGSNAYRDLGRFNANEVAIVAALAIPMAMALLARGSRGIWSVLNATYPILAVATIVMSASRGGLVVGLIALASVPFVFTRVGVGVRSLLFVLIATTVVGGAQLVRTTFPELQSNVERLAGTATELTEGDLTGRTVIWGATFELFMESPIVGVGAGAPAYALLESELARVVAVHNGYLSIAAGGGLIALVLFLALLGVAMAASLGAPPTVRPFLVVLGLALLIAYLPANIEARKFAWFVLVVLACHRPLVIAPRARGLARPPSPGHAPARTALATASAPAAAKGETSQGPAA